jgi:hypothetical protein
MEHHQEAAFRAAGASNDDIEAIDGAGGYAAVLADVDLQERLQDVLDPIIQRRLASVEAALQSAGWLGGRYGRLEKKEGDVVLSLASTTVGVGAFESLVASSWAHGTGNEVIDDFNLPHIEFAAVVDAAVASPAAVLAVKPKADADPAPGINAQLAQSMAVLDQADILAVDHLKAVVTDQNPMPDVPTGWIIMNASRPLLGSRRIDGDGMHLNGRWYAAIDPGEGSVAQAWLDRNVRDDARVVFVASKEQQTAMALQTLNSRYADGYMKMDTVQRELALRPFVNRLSEKTIGELRALAALDVPKVAAPAPTTEDQPVDISSDPNVPKFMAAPAVAAEARTRAAGLALIDGVAEELGGVFSEWRQSGSMWQYADLAVGAATMSIGVSDGGVVQVNGDPFTDYPERAMHTTHEAVRKSVQAAVQKSLSAQQAEIAPTETDLKIARLAELSGKTVEQTRNAMAKARLRMDESEVLALLDTTLANYEAAEKNRVSETDVAKLDLSTVQGVTRALQLQLAADILKKGLKYDQEQVGKRYMTEERATCDALQRQAEHDRQIAAAPYKHHIEMAEQILSKDPIPLIQKFVYGSFESAERVFAKVTGVRVLNLPSKKKIEALYQWAGWSAERVGEFEAAVAEKQAVAAAALAAEEAATQLASVVAKAEKKQYRNENGTVMSAKALIDDLVAKGYRTLTEQKKGAVNTWSLSNGSTGLCLRLKNAFEGAYAKHVIANLPVDAPVVDGELVALAPPPSAQAFDLRSNPVLVSEPLFKLVRAHPASLSEVRVLVDGTGPVQAYAVSSAILASHGPIKLYREDGSPIADPSSSPATFSQQLVNVDRVLHIGATPDQMTLLRTRKLREDLDAGLVKPASVVGGGYKNGRKVAEQYLDRRIAELEAKIPVQVPGRTAPVAGLGTGEIERKKVGLADRLVENIDTDLRDLYEEATGKIASYSEVFDWVQNLGFKTQKTNNALLDIAVKRGFILGAERNALKMEADKETQHVATSPGEDEEVVNRRDSREMTM